MGGARGLFSLLQLRSPDQGPDPDVPLKAGSLSQQEKVVSLSERISEKIRFMRIAGTYTLTWPMIRLSFCGPWLLGCDRLEECFRDDPGIARTEPSYIYGIRPYSCLKHSKIRQKVPTTPCSTIGGGEMW